MNCLGSGICGGNNFIPEAATAPSMNRRGSFEGTPLGGRVLLKGRRLVCGETDWETSLVLPPPSAQRNSNSRFPPNVVAVGGEWQWWCAVSAKEPRRSGGGDSILKQQLSSITNSARGWIAGFGSTDGAA